MIELSIHIDNSIAEMKELSYMFWVEVCRDCDKEKTHKMIDRGQGCCSKMSPMLILLLTVIIAVRAACVWYAHI